MHSRKNKERSKAFLQSKETCEGTSRLIPNVHLVALSIGEPEPLWSKRISYLRSFIRLLTSGSHWERGMVEKERTGSVITGRLRYCQAPPPRLERLFWRTCPYFSPMVSVDKICKSPFSAVIIKQSIRRTNRRRSASWKCDIGVRGGRSRRELRQSVASAREKDKCKSDLKWKVSFTCGPLNDSTVPRWTAEANYSGERAGFFFVFLFLCKGLSDQTSSGRTCHSAFGSRWVHVREAAPSLNPESRST